ncbi:high-affinity glucose transporter, partial [Scheffersomyces xylosifermentans]|uniref:high-affinity glucose transporter n=1 Tax=Scheffersomyces xylosifermentans TaxID=1304137 RepID=UPI00315C5F28
MALKVYNIYGITSIVAICGILLGMESSSWTTLLSSPQFKSYFGEISSWENAMVMSSNGIGAVVGCIICGVFCDALGCIRSFQVAGVCWIGGSICSFFSPYIYLIVLGRLFKGMSMGFLSAVIPIYLSETIPSEKKGSSISFVQLNSAIAGLLMYFVTYAFQLLIKDEYSFKYAWGIEALPAIALLILSFFLPESPKWLASQSKWTQAAKNLVKIKRSQNRLEAAKDHKRTHDDDRDFVLKAYTAGPEIRTCTYDKVFGKKYWKHTLIGTSSQFFVQLSSVQILKNHFLFICDICGIDGDNRAYYSSSHYMVEVLFTLIPLFLLDSARRKDCLTFGMFILGGSYLAVGVLVLVYSEKAVHGDINSPFQFEMFEEPASGVLAIFLFISAVYSSTVLSTSWLYAGEIFPGPARAKGTSICMGASWVVNTASALVLPSMLRHMGPWAFMMLSLCCFCGTIVLVTVPETRNLSEQEIESIF